MEDYYLANVEKVILAECSYDEETAPKEEKETTMKTLDQEKLEHFDTRLRHIFYSKRDALSKQFGLWHDDLPNTPEELVKRIKDGKYVIRDVENDCGCCYDPIELISWRDPAIVKDKAGYDAAVIPLEAAYQTARDQLYADVTKALDALAQFQAA